MTLQSQQILSPVASNLEHGTYSTDKNCISLQNKDAEYKFD